MTMLSKDLIAILENEFGSKLQQYEKLAGGSINDSFRISFIDGQRYFLKFNQRHSQEFFLAEAKGLDELQRALGDQSDLKVPRIVFCPVQSSACFSFLVLEWLDPIPGTSQLECKFAQGLAQMHLGESELFGSDTNNFIGDSIQYNQWSDNWTEFFLKMRLDRQMAIARREGWLTQKLQQLYARRREEIESLLTCIYVRPCLVHGDLWSGNVLYARDGVYLIDPAIYYGHSEVDLACLEGLANIFMRRISRLLSQSLAIHSEERFIIFTIS